MLIDAWHHYWLLRPLLVFVLAMPLIVGAVFSRGHGGPRNPEAETHDESQEAKGPATRADPQPQGERGVGASPREWPVGDPGSERRAA